MLRAKTLDGVWVAAKDYHRGAVCVCPQCGGRLSVVQDSEFFIEHFRHAPGGDCGFGGGEESEEHEQYVDFLLGRVRTVVGTQNAEKEYRLHDGQRPDVYFELPHSGQKVAVEVQRAVITDKELAERTASYATKGVAAHWIAMGVKDALNSAPINPRTGLAELPASMRRLSRLGDGTAYDEPLTRTDLGQDIIGVSLTPKYKVVKDEHGNWVNNMYFLVTMHRECDGMQIIRKDDHGWEQRLWRPKVISSGDDLATRRTPRILSRRELTRAEIDAAAIECMRPPVEPETIVTPAPLPEPSFHTLTLQYWEGLADLPPKDRRKMMGY